MREENSGEEGLLAEVIEGEGDKQKITAKAVKARLKEIGKDPDYADERTGARRRTLTCSSSRPRPRPGSRPRRRTWTAKLDAKYPKLTEAEIKTLVVDDKWMAPGRRRAGRTGPRLADPHRPHPRTGRTLRHAAAAAHRRSGDARRPRRRAPQEDGGGMEVKPGYKQTEVGVIPEDWEVAAV